MAWRDKIAVHPAAQLLPPMSPEELRELGEDIRKRGLDQRLMFFVPQKRKNALRGMTQSVDAEHKKARGELELLDGVNRLNAMELVGLLDDKRLEEELKRAKTFWLDDGNPEDFVISANLMRRQLTNEQKRGIAAELLQRNPAQSNLAIGKKVRTQ